jgi:DNA-binding transcriptional MerR regulator
MSTERYSLQDLADQTGIELRTIRSYIQTGVLPRPSSSGRGAFYGPEHLNRLKAMRVLREQERRSLDEVRAFFLTSSEQQIAEKAAALVSPASIPEADASRRSSAGEYLQQLKESMGGSWTGHRGPRPSRKTTAPRQHIVSEGPAPGELSPVQRAITILSTLTNEPRPHAGTRVTGWQRMEIVPGVELHIDSALGLDSDELRRLCDYIREFIQGG